MYLDLIGLWNHREPKNKFCLYRTKALNDTFMKNISRFQLYQDFINCNPHFLMFLLHCPTFVNFSSLLFVFFL